jgi:hypothetical protein
VVEVGLRGVRLHGFPAFAVVQLHPVVLAVFNFARVLERLREEFAKVLVVGCVFEA